MVATLLKEEEVKAAAGGGDDLGVCFADVKSRALLFLVLAACGVPVALGACSHASSSSSSTPLDPDAGAGDATLTFDGPDNHGIYPAPHPQIPDMRYFGGRVIKNPSLVTVTFAGMDPVIRDYVRDFDDKITQSAWWKTVMSGYAVDTGSGGGYAELPDVFSGMNTSDAEVKSYIAAQITAGKLPFPTDSTMYLLYIPFAALIDLDPSNQSCRQFGGYHGSGEVVTDGGAKRYIFAILNDCRGPGGTTQQLMDDATYVSSHEIAEAATDPDINTNEPGGWYMPAGNDAWVTSRSGGENADLCNGLGWKEPPWTVTRVWNPESAKASGAPCLPSPTTWNFGAALVTENPRTAQKVGPNADGYVVVKMGESRDFEIDVFSTAPLPSAMTLAVGRFATPITGQPYDPMKSLPITSGVTATLSQTTAVNGDRVRLTIAIDPSLHTVTKRFSVRAVLSPTDYHSWPAILYVP